MRAVFLVALFVGACFAQTTLNKEASVVFEGCSTLETRAPCFSNALADGGAEATSVPSFSEILFQDFSPLVAQNRPPLAGITWGDATSSYALINNGDGLALYETASSNGETTLTWTYQTYCNAIIPVGIVGDYVFAVTADSQRCQCKDEDPECQYVALVAHANGTSAALKVRNYIRDAPLILYPMVNKTSKWVCCASEQNKGVYAMHDSSLAAHLHHRCHLILCRQTPPAGRLRFVLRRAQTQSPNLCSSTTSHKEGALIKRRWTTGRKWMQPS